MSAPTIDFITRARKLAADTRAVVAGFVAFYFEHVPFTDASRRQMRRAVARVNAAADALEDATEPAAVEHALGVLAVRSLEVRALFEEHPDELARALSVMARSAPAILGDADGEPVAQWCGALLAGDAA